MPVKGQRLCCLVIFTGSRSSGAVRSADWRLLQLFGFILARLVSQVAVGKVNSSQRVAQDSATVGCL